MKENKTMSLNKFTIQKSFAISAGAGSGKTYTLSRRYINALLGFDYFREDYGTDKSYFKDLKPAKVNEIVTITYTEAAALEMKGRIFELISKIINFETLDEKDKDLKSIKEANKNITKQEHSYVLKTLSKAYTDSSNSKISTIHAYCLGIIKTNSDIARIDAKLDIIKEDEKASQLAKIIFDVLNDSKNQETVMDISKDISMFFFNNLINKYVSSTKFRSDYDSFSKESIELDTYKKLILELYPLPNVEDVLEELESDEVRLDWFKRYYKNFVEFNALSWKEILEDVKVPSLGATKFPITTEAKGILESLISHYSFIDTQKESEFFEKIEKIKTILHQIKTKYDNKLKELGKIDFDTIILKTLDLMPDATVDFKYIMVDEFQDTNATQFEIIKNSCNKHTNLFVVGDSKQSIYSFQGAEIEVFNDAVSNTELFSSIESMSKNHRTDGVVLDRVNKIFEKLLTKDTHLKLISQNYEAQKQDLEVFKEERKEKGSFKYLITSQPYQEEKSELDTIAQFVSEVCSGEQKEYKHITDLITAKDKAIAIIFDSSTKMLELKQKLREKGITAKVTASDNFYHTKEINDIFNVLKAIDILSKEPKELTNTQKYYVVGAMRSNILKIDDNTIKKYLETNTISDKLKEYIEVFNTQPLSIAIKYIYDDSNIIGTYAHFDDLEQRVANLYKFLTLCMEYQDSDESNLYKFLSLLENSIYFSEAKEDEAFFKSDNTKSIEICSIHSTKGLAYPLVLLGNSDKGLYSQITSDSLKHNNFKIGGEKKEIVGFKINNYTPVSHRVLKEIDKLKHLAEKKRLLYVALTRAEYDVVISAHLKQKKDGGVTLRVDSYLQMMIESLGITKEELFHQERGDCLQIKTPEEITTIKKKISFINHTLQPIKFESRERISATSEGHTYNETAAQLGTVTHRIFELYWDVLEDLEQEKILSKFQITEDAHTTQIKNSIEKFLSSDVYSNLKSGAEHKFELEFNTTDKRGLIDLVYFDKNKNGWVIVDFKTGNQSKEKELEYQKQLDFYENALLKSGLNISEKKILWV